MTNFTHCEALSATRNPSACDGVLIYERKSFFDDVKWSVYVCERCDALVYTVNDTHWWNFEREQAPRHERKTL